jgi:hypothetical protein
MSIPFSDTANFKGLVQLYEQEIGANPGDVSGNTTKLKQFTARVNLALDKYNSIAVPASGTWELDDNNHTDDYDIIYATINSGQKDYTWLTDENGNTILDVQKVLVLPSDTATTYVEVEPVSELLAENVDMIDENGATGVPSRYAKRANGIRFDVIPNYTKARGIKILVSRESSYFTYTDTTKKPGYPYHQEYFFLQPACEEARINNLSVLPRLEKKVYDLEGDPKQGVVGLIAEAYSARQKDVRNVMTGKRILYI